VIELVQGDARELSYTADGIVDLVLADPPYGLSKPNPTSGKTHPGKEGFGSEDDSTYTTLGAGWDIFEGDYAQFTIDWLIQARRVLRPAGSLMICTSFHNEHIINSLGLLLGLKLVSRVTVCKTNAPPSITRRQPTPSTESILWFAKGTGWHYSYQEAKKFSDGKQLRDFWIMAILRSSESLGYRSQKPLSLFQRCIEIATQQGGSRT
jgi:site-specific DNA-methyltransferase (adenine-specific)